ncbi:spore coat protein [Evansella tamaricis]|uniref:Spore coat protein n=1 Tax=Evansella tamaricis TaxID=2069301 RepID=A0ABS6JGR1_9BACI|nr:spore coat protein [Evansella tamaricis]MBU9712855.1 spore coat protein [Evansella tamaricis]
MHKEHLAWHETLEIHELVAFQANGLMKVKMSFPDIRNVELKKIYQKAIKGMSKNLQELLEFFPDMPRDESRGETDRNLTPFYAGDLLGLAKATVRNYAIAITETATPEVRKVLKKQLNDCIDLHAQIFEFMEKSNYYPAYNLEELLANDMKNAKKALSMREE